jgi:MoaA/NifB/PqqE/SkfB family radical SAM enzyme
LKSQTITSGILNEATDKPRSQNVKYVNPLNKALGIFFKEAVKVSLKNPSQSLYFLQTVRNQKKSARRRAALKKEGINVPPIMIFSITNRCNLHCQGCYHQALRDTSKAEMNEKQLESIMREARDLGVSFMVLAGGEPLMRKDILDMTGDLQDVIFFMFTNGLLISDDMAVRFKGQKNLIPLISLEGYDQDTDKRRGEGVFEHLRKVIDRLKKQGVFFGISLTVTHSNFDTVTNPKFIQNIINLGGKLLLFAEYTPAKEGTESWVITEEQRLKLADLIQNWRNKNSALFVNVPGDEKDFGGCLSAGRGFVHVSAEGDLEPCPFAPYSDANLREKSLKEGLQSPFLQAIRECNDHLQESNGSCALWTRRKWVRSLLSSTTK